MTYHASDGKRRIYSIRRCVRSGRRVEEALLVVQLSSGEQFHLQEVVGSTQRALKLRLYEFGSSSPHQGDWMVDVCEVGSRLRLCRDDGIVLDHYHCRTDTHTDCHRQYEFLSDSPVATIRDNGTAHAEAVRIGEIKGRTLELRDGMPYVPFFSPTPR